MLEYLLPSTHILALRNYISSDGILDKCYGRICFTKLTTEGIVIIDKVVVPLPTLVVAITNKYSGIRAISVDGNVYSISNDRKVTKEDIPEPLSAIMYVGGCSFAVAEEGNVYYSLYNQGWRILTGIHNLTRIVSGSKNDGIYIFADGWYNVLTNSDVGVVALPVHPSVQDIMIEDDEVSMLIDGVWFCI